MGDLVERLRDGLPGEMEGSGYDVVDGQDADALFSEAADEITALRKEVANLEANGIHTCHADCQRPLCVAQRDVAALRERVGDAEAALREIESGQVVISGPGQIAFRSPAKIAREYFARVKP